MSNLSQLNSRQSVAHSPFEVRRLRHTVKVLCRALMLNIADRQRAETILQITQTRLSQIINTTSDALVVLSRDGHVRFVNPAAEILFGRSSTQLLNHCLGIPYAASETTEICVLKSDGKHQIAEMRVSEISWNGEMAYLASIRDITDRHQTQQQLKHQALHDPLTDLPNRSLFLDRLQHALQRQKRQQSSFIVVLFLDLDHFKLINDSFGHLIGDQLLQSFARRLQTHLRTSDTLARLGGDEFAILLENLTDREEALQIAQRIQQQLQIPFQLQGQELFANASIGIALDIMDYERPEQLLRDADMAMYRAKTLGRGRYVVFEPEMRQQALQKLQLEAELRKAIDRQELVIHYQPIVTLLTGELTGFEALVRWQHPQQGLLLPAQFIPLAEETGLIVAIDQWVLAESCRQLSLWLAQNDHSESLTMNVNLSSQHFNATTLPEYLSVTLNRSGLKSKNLKLELTETGLIENLDGAAGLLEQANAMQIQLCLDDFGTGYSSLSYLHRFPVSCLKIDRSFVSHMQAGNGNWEIVRTIITLSNTLGIETVAEGIETAHQWSQLKELGCIKGQGYFFSKPLASQMATALLTEASERLYGLQGRNPLEVWQDTSQINILHDDS